MNVSLDGISSMSSSYDYINNYGSNPSVLIIFALIIVIYYVIFASLGSTAQTPDITPESSGIVFIEVMMWSVFIILILLNGMKYFFNINVTASIHNLFKGTPEVDIVVDQSNSDLFPEEPIPEPVPEITTAKQVFHIPNNVYTYKNAKALCNAYGADLASYDQIENAYKDGAEWCSYGWSDEQMAYFPTQKGTFNKLRKIKGRENDCGRPGINGGFISNPNVRFGANCYGYKPKITNLEEQMMETQTLVPKTKEDINFERKVDHWRNKLPNILVSPFNRNKWSRF